MLNLKKENYQGLGNHADEVDEMIWEKEIEIMLESYLVDEPDYRDWDDSGEVWHGNGD